MKRSTLISSLLVALVVGMTGCNKNESVDTSKVESSLASADASAKPDLEKAIAAVKAGDYAAATAPLQKLVANAKLTPEQQSAVKDLMSQIVAKTQEAMNKAGSEAADAMKKAQDSTGKALQDVGGALKK